MIGLCDQLMSPPHYIYILGHTFEVQEASLANTPTHSAEISLEAGR